MEIEKFSKWEQKKIDKLLKDKPFLAISLREMTDKEQSYYLTEVLKDNNLIVPKEVNLQDIHDLYSDLLYIEDTNRIDIILATALSNKLEGIPIWLILVGASGDMKSVQLNSIRTKDVYLLHNLTSKSLVNGYKDKEEHPDLAPELDGKIIIIPDMAQILKLPTIEKAEIWGQLRDLYDGFAGKVSGMGSRQRYENIRTTLIAGSTPAIDGQILVHQDLGTRELLYRTLGNKNKQKLMEKCFENEELEEKIKTILTEVTSSFLENTPVKRIEINRECLEEIKKIAIFISYMRATAEIDSYSNTLRNDVYPEEPSRISKQLKRIFICLKNLDKNYPDKTALKILWHLGKSSSFPIRNKIFETLINDNCEYSTSQISDMLHTGKSTSQRELGILWNMRLVNCRKEKTNFFDRTYDYWTINQKNKFVKSLISDNTFALSNRPLI